MFSGWCRDRWPPRLLGYIRACGKEWDGHRSAGALAVHRRRRVLPAGIQQPQPRPPRALRRPARPSRRTRHGLRRLGRRPAAATPAQAPAKRQSRAARDRFAPPSLVAARNAPVLPGLRSLLEFAHPAFAIIGLGFWLGYTLVHYRLLGWIAFGLVTATVCLGLNWFAANTRAARRRPQGRARAVLQHPPHRPARRGRRGDLHAGRPDRLRPGSVKAGRKQSGQCTRPPARIGGDERPPSPGSVAERIAR